jgi:predicted PurR-regulated permease PerM
MSTKSVKKIEISSNTVFRIVLILLAFWLVYVVFDIVLMLFAAFIVASVVEPIARSLDKYKIPRALSVLTVYVLVLVIIGGVLGLMVEPLAMQTRQLATVVPSIVNSLNDITPLIPHIDQADLIESMQSGLLNFGDNVANFGLNVFAGTRSVIAGFVNFLFIFVIALYLVVQKDALKKFARLLTPKEHYPYVAQAIERAQRSIGRWVLAQIVLGIIVGVIVGIGLWIIGVPYALLLGILAGVMEIVPVIGPMIAATPGVLVAITQGWTIGLAAFIFYIINGQFESHILIPNVMKRAVGLPPLVTIIAVILGARLLGVIGIVLAVPAATIISIFVSDVASVDESQEMSG